MFLSNLFCGNQTNHFKQTLETFRQVPREELQEYQFNKGRIRYESGFKDSAILPSMSVSFMKFKNNEPLDIVEDSIANVKHLMFENTGKVVKKIRKSNYEQLLDKYKRSYQLYCDPDFKPCPQSIGKTFYRKNCEWKRISEIIPKPEFVSQTISPEDILQGQLGNCYFLSAIAALAENDFRIKNIFPKLEINKNGFYMARILHQGVLQQVVVDDYIPVDSQGKPIFAKPAGGKQIWVMILEKCWAKLFGSYEAIVGGLPNQVLHAFSSAPTFYHKITEIKAEQDQLFQTLMEANIQSSVMCCGTKSDPSIQKMGLVIGHAYTLLQVYEKPYRMLKIRNPWGEKEWNGRASEFDKAFWLKISPIDRDRLGHTFENDGTFFMLWDDFLQYFSMVDICKVNDNANYYCFQDTYVSDKPKVFEFEISGGEVVVSFSQPNLRTLDWRQKKKGYGTSTLVIAKQTKVGSQVVYKYVESRQDHSFADFSVVLNNLQAGKYLVYASVIWTRKDSDLATISVYTQSKVTMKGSELNPNEFLYKVYLDHAQNNKQNIQTFCSQPYQWACSDLLSQKCGFGYLVFHLDKNSKRKIGLEINQRDYTDNRLQLLVPYKGKGTFKVTAQPGKQLVIMFRMQPGDYAVSFTLPVPKMFLLY